MNRGMLWVLERPTEIAQLMREEGDERVRQRLRLVYLMALQPTRRRVDLARELGVNRETVGRWVRRYERGGLSRLLEMKRAPGRVGLLSEEMKAGLGEEVKKGELNYVRLQCWVREKYEIEVSYRVVRYEVQKQLRESSARPGAEFGVASQEAEAGLGGSKLTPASGSKFRAC